MLYKSKQYLMWNIINLSLCLYEIYLCTIPNINKEGKRYYEKHFRFSKFIGLFKWLCDWKQNNVENYLLLNRISKIQIILIKYQFLFYPTTIYVYTI